MANKYEKAAAVIAAGPDRHKTNMLIRSLRALDIRVTDFEYLKNMLKPLVHGYSVSFTTTNVDEPIYRAVLWKERPEVIGKLGCPPAEKVKLGRANIPGNPVFYSSAGCHSTIMELEPKIGDRVAISKWQTKKNLQLICLGYKAEAFKGKSGFNRIESLPWVKQYAQSPSSKKAGNQMVHDFMAREFTKKVHPENAWEYKISAAISELLINVQPLEYQGETTVDIAGVAYPSFPNEGNADNVALKCAVVAEHLEFVHVQYLEISKKSNGPEYGMLGLDFADSLSADGSINWKNEFPPDRIAGTDITVRRLPECFELVNNKGVVVAKFDGAWSEGTSANRNDQVAER